MEEIYVKFSELVSAPSTEEKKILKQNDKLKRQMYIN